MKFKAILFISICLIVAPKVKAQDNLALTLVEQQTNAYNKRSINTFLEAYSKDIEIYNYPNERLVRGKKNLKTQYEQIFKQYDQLRITVYKRAVLGNTIINWEMTTGFPDHGITELIAIYKIKDGKIRKVFWLIK